MHNVMFNAVKGRLQIEEVFFANGVTPDEIKLLDTVEKQIAKAYHAGYQAAVRAAPQLWSNQCAFGYAITRLSA
ncbi:hypothetical protein FHS16_001758 [Paenibacillus endophyticus]|uniref:Uncharacterized protein n=1 Tax=Paenibacillus endophyticus TaxID=1294268 RepID=A0A7W5C5S3_9BACL|nr:hypothetical protein [Paenibacillus endophyticus]MBB3151712.1 hypothetical protein [Paenibacillus endophyticus]